MLLNVTQFIYWIIKWWLVLLHRTLWICKLNWSIHLMMARKKKGVRSSAGGTLKLPPPPPPPQPRNISTLTYGTFRAPSNNNRPRATTTCCVPWSMLLYRGRGRCHPKEEPLRPGTLMYQPQPSKTTQSCPLKSSSLVLFVLWHLMIMYCLFCEKYLGLYCSSVHKIWYHT